MFHTIMLVLYAQQMLLQLCRSNSNTTMLRIDIFPPSNVVETTHSSEGQLTMLQNWNRWKPCLCLFVPGVVLMSWYTGWCLIHKSYVLGKNFCKTNKCYTIIPTKCFILLLHNYAQNKMYQHEFESLSFKIYRIESRLAHILSTKAAESETLVREFRACWLELVDIYKCVPGRCTSRNSRSSC